MGWVSWVVIHLFFCPLGCCPVVLAVSCCYHVRFVVVIIVTLNK